MMAPAINARLGILEKQLTELRNRFAQIELAAEEFESESSFEDGAPVQPDAIPSNNTSDLFHFFREQARLAFLNRGN